MNLLILGANSDIAYAIANRFAKEKKADVVLASRNLELLHKKVRELKIRHGVDAHAIEFDTGAYASHASLYRQLDPKPDVVVAAFGYFGSQALAQKDFEEARRIIETNFTGAVSILEIVAADFQKRGSGTIIGISSVAGDRGRQSNYIYGAAKSAFSTYLDGLRNRLARHRVHVMTVKPGFVHTKMTAGMDLPGPITASAEQAAGDIYAGWLSSKNTLYTRWFWRWIMAIIRGIPEPLFKRMQL
jgi:short-subunit dehydrogenase